MRVAHQIFTLSQLFNEPSLKDKLPLVNATSYMDEGKFRISTKMETVYAMVYRISSETARPFYDHFKATKKGGKIDLDGTLVAESKTTYMTVLDALKSSKWLLERTANDGDIIRLAMKDGIKTGHEPKLYLYDISLEAIANSDKRRRGALLNQVMANIYFNPEFARVQEKYDFSKRYDYEAMRKTWEKLTGER